MQGKSLSIMLLYIFPETDKELDDKDNKTTTTNESRHFSSGWVCTSYQRKYEGKFYKKNQIQ